jgi:GlpG protein
MRQIATLPPDRAQLFADYLLTLQIETRLERQAQGVALWVRDEDKVQQARTELEAFLSDPMGQRYTQARGKASALREQLQGEDEDDLDDDEDEEEEEAPARSGPTLLAPLTLLVALACVAVFLQASPGDMGSRGYDPGPVYDSLAINSAGTAKDGFLADVRAGQLWRLLTPALLHLDPMHLAVNVALLVYLGSSVERGRGAFRTLLLMLLLALVSNLAEYVFFGPKFYGASGVLFGLVGFLWIKGIRQPDLGLDLPPGVVVFAMVVLVCGWLVELAPQDLRQKLVGGSGAIANMQHTAGLLAGMALALLPSQPIEQAPAAVPEDEAP